MSDIARAEAASSFVKPARRPKTTAGRLLVTVMSDETLTLRHLADCIDVPESALADCAQRDIRLAAHIQMRLATAVITLAPQHSGEARRLFGQAEAALYYENDGVAFRHMTYPRSRFR